MRTLKKETPGTSLPASAMGRQAAKRRLSVNWKLGPTGLQHLPPLWSWTFPVSGVVTNKLLLFIRPSVCDICDSSPHRLRLAFVIRLGFTSYLCYLLVLWPKARISPQFPPLLMMMIMSPDREQLWGFRESLWIKHLAQHWGLLVTKPV